MYALVFNVNLLKLRLSIFGTLALIISLSTLFLTVLLSITGLFNLITLGVLVVALNIGQWLIAPYIVEGLYRIKEIKQTENPQLHSMVRELSRKSRMKKPKLMLARIPLPNAFAYSSPLAGNRVAVTKGLLENLDEGEVEAVIGHELGHLKHKDVQIMMFVSILPALLYYIGYSFIISSMYNRQRNEGGGSALIGVGFMLFSWFLNLFILYLSRLREYYADTHSTLVVASGSQKLSEGLAKIVSSTKKMGKVYRQTKHLNAFKAMFITDPDRVDTDALAISKMNMTSDQKLVQGILSRKLTTIDRVLEVFSTHPNIVKRLRSLQKVS